MLLCITEENIKFAIQFEGFRRGNFLLGSSVNEQGAENELKNLEKRESS
jgi:hypothetical protein